MEKVLESVSVVMDLSIIMPVYNAEKYLRKTLNSINKCLDKNVELIIVNDCSKDNSAEIIKEFIENNKSKNIVYIDNKENKGAGSSKNIALKKSKGKYIGFIDADDYVKKDYFKNMLDMAEKNNADLIVSDIALDYDKYVIYKNIFDSNVYNKNDNGEINIDKNILYGYWGCASACSKLFKRELINGLNFSISKTDDVMFSIPAINRAKKILYCRDNNYYYVQSQNSLTRTNNINKYFESIDILFTTVEYLEKNSCMKSAQIYAANAQLPFLCYSLLGVKEKDINKILSIIKECIKKYEYDLKNLITRNKYLKNSLLIETKIYSDILECISLEQYDKIPKLIRDSKTSIYQRIRNGLIMLKNNPKKFIYKLKMKLFKLDDTFNPLVTIVIPVYNGENYLKEAIDSALSQTYKNIEILVINDGSKDNTEKIALSYGEKVRYIRKENGGVASALNLAIKEMKGEYFSWLSHDDLYFENKIEKQVEFLKYQKNRDIVLFSNYILIDQKGKQINEPVIINSKLLKLNKRQEYCLLRGCINGITMLIPKKVFKDVGKFNENLRCVQDYDMWHRMLKKYKFVHCNEIVSKTRIHPNQDTNSNPLAVTEGDDLWTMLIEDVSDKRKKKLEGSIFNFYMRMLDHLKYAPYENTKKLCLEKCKSINSKKTGQYLSSREKRNTIYYYIKKVGYALKYHGLKETIKAIKRNLKKNVKN